MFATISDPQGSLTAADLRASELRRGGFPSIRNMDNLMVRKKGWATKAGTRWKKVPPRRLTWQLVITAVAFWLPGWFGGQPAWAAETGRMVQKNGEWIYVEDVDPATKLLLDRAVKQGAITQEEYEEVRKASQARAQALAPDYKLWYDKGFNFSFNDNAFFLKIRAMTQLRYTHWERNSLWNTQGDFKNYPQFLGVFGNLRASRYENTSDTFQNRRARLYFMGHLFDPDFKYYIQLGAETGEEAANASGVTLFDWNFQVTRIPWANVWVGQYKVLFNRAQINSTASMQFAERALVSDSFTASGLNRRDIGITLMNDESFPFNYYFGVFNGTGPDVTGLGSFQSEDINGGDNFRGRQYAVGANFKNNANELMYTARLNWNILGRPGYAEGDLAYSETPQLSVGGGYSYNPGINTSSSYDPADPANSNFSLQSDLTDLTIAKRQMGATGNGRLLGNGVMNLTTWTLDTNIKYRGWSLHSEFYFRNNTLRDQVIRNIPRQLGNSTGWYVQSGYYLIPKRLEFAARYALWDPDTKASEDLIKQFDAALTYSFQSTYDHKIVLQYTNVTMGTGGFAAGRSAPDAVNVGTTGGVPNIYVVDGPGTGSGQDLVSQAVMIQLQIFF
jgi:hypothetical protein